MRWGLLCGLVCVACPLGIVWLGFSYGFDQLEQDSDYREWPIYAMNGLFCLDVVATIGLLCALRSRWWLGSLVAVPMLIATAILAVTGGMWVEGTYF